MFSESQMLNTFVLDASTCARGEHFSALCRRGGLKISLAAGLALASIGLTAGEAHAVVVNVGGQDYDVTTFTGTYDDYASKFATPANGGVMPWWEGNTTNTVDPFVTAVGSLLGEPNTIFGDTFGPIFAKDGYVYGRYYGYNGNNQIQDYLRSGSESRVWAQVAPASSAAVPGPLPALGAAAAFGFSRKLRKRINRSAKTVPSTYSL